MEYYPEKENNLCSSNAFCSLTRNGKPHTKHAIEASETRPSALPVLADGIPADLRDRPQWVVWQYGLKDGKPGNWTKIPFRADAGNSAKCNDPATWTTFEAAHAAYQRGGWDGVMFAFSPDDPYCGVDVDDGRDPETGRLHEWADDLVSRIGSYTEASPSGTGVKIFARGRKPGARCKTSYEAGEVEMYDSARFFTVTGQRLDWTPTEIIDQQPALDALYALLFPEKKKPTPSAPLRNGHIAAPEDDKVLDLARRASNGHKFDALWRGDTSGHGEDHSSADMALCNLLAFYTRDEAQIDRLFRSSGLYREKWDQRHYGDGRTYGEGTIRNALDFMTDSYSPRRQQESNYHQEGSGVDTHSETSQPISPEAPVSPTATEIILGPLVLRLEDAHQTASRKVVVQVGAYRDDKLEYLFPVSTASSSQKAPARRLADLLGDDSARGQIDNALMQILVAAAETLKNKPQRQGCSLREIVAKRVPCTCTSPIARSADCGRRPMAEKWSAASS